EGALSYKKFTGAAELGELVAGDLAALLAEGFGARDGGVRLPVIPLPKTRLALAVAERTRRQWSGGAAFVDLSAVSDPALVPDAIASALGLVGQGRERPLDTVKRGLAGRDMLIVLDNFEQVLGAAPVVADLLQSAPGLRVLVTSRVVLRVRGEQEWRVDPLGVPPPGIALEALAEN